MIAVCERALLKAIKSLKGKDEFERLDLSSFKTITDNDVDFILRRHSKFLRKLYCTDLKSITRIGGIANTKGSTIDFPRLSCLDIRGNDNLTSLDIHIPPSCIIHGAKEHLIRIKSTGFNPLMLHDSDLQHSKLLEICDSSLTHFPEPVASYRDFRALYLPHNRIQQLPSEMSRFQALEELDLSSNSITSLEGCGFEHLTRLQKLKIGFNQITDLYPSVVSISSLIKLEVYENEITSFLTNENALPLLEVLDLRNNKIRSINSILSGALPSLACLDLSGNQLITLPSSFTRISKLEKLDLENNQIIGLPPSFARLSNLFVLNLSSNKISSLSFDLEGIKTLTTLKLDSNQLQCIESNFSVLSNLTHLSLSKNNIETIDLKVFRSLRQLVVFDLGYNNLSSLPREIAFLSSLQSLNISFNRLSVLPPALLQLTNLSSLYASGNNFSGHLEAFNILPECENMIDQLKHIQSC